MKLLVCFSVLVFSTVTFAKSYSCINSEGNVAHLKVSKNQKTIQWNEEATSADSFGSFLKIEDAPYSELKGNKIFWLADFLTTDDSRFELALSSEKDNHVKVSVYFNNDDHQEETTSYDCSRKF